jgi:hypothetical protein
LGSRLKGHRVLDGGVLYLSFGVKGVLMEKRKLRFGHADSAPGVHLIVQVGETDSRIDFGVLVHGANVVRGVRVWVGMLVVAS